MKEILTHVCYNIAMSKKLVIGNWKMNPATLDEAKGIASKVRSAASRLDHTEVIACPPFVYIASTGSTGAQSVSAQEGGAHTGEVSARMLADLGVEYVIVGHSEERHAGDTDEIVSKKLASVIDAGMTAVVCVGEKLREESGSHFEYIKKQMKASLDGVPSEKAKKIVLAYEPIWAIGAREAMQPDQVCEMAIFVKKIFSDIFGLDAGRKVRVLYGGAVNAGNAAAIMAVGKVDGLLVGRESVNVPGFVELLKEADAIR